MPPAILVGAVASGLSAAALGVTIGTLGVAASAFVIAGVNLALGLVSQALAPKASLAEQVSDRSVTTRATAEPRTLVFGEIAIGGSLVLDEGGGANKQYRYVVEDHADHPCDGILDWYVQNELVGDRDVDGNVTTGRFAGFLRLTPLLGAFDQAADPTLVGEIENWTEAHKGGGVCATVIRAEWSADVWPNGFSSLRARLRGMPVYDPRDAGVAIATSSITDPAVFTTDVPHGLSVGQQVWIKNHLGAIITTAAGDERFIGRWHQIASVPATTTFTLIDEDGKPVAFTTGGTAGTVTAMAWSDNWALCVRMYLAHRWTFNALDDEIDDTVLIAQANICDEQVALTPEAEVFTADAATNRITLGSPRTWKTGDVAPVSTTGTLPSPLLAATDYYLIRVDSTTYALASTLENARIGESAAIVLTDAGTGAHTATRNSQLRYTCNGAARLDGDPWRPLEAMMTAAAGVVTNEAGLLKVFAGAATAVTGATVTASDLRDGDMEIEPYLPIDQAFNAARGKFVDPDKFWTDGDAPLYQNDTYRLQDNGERRVKDLGTLGFTTDPVMAQRLLKIAVERGRQGVTCVFPAKPRRFATTVWDVQAITLPEFGWSAKEFRVMGWSESPDFGIDIIYREEAAAVWDWALGDETTVDLAPNSTLPSATAVGLPTAFVVTEELYDTRDGSGVKARAVLDWAAADDAFVTDGGGYDVRYRLVGAPTFTVVPRDDDTSHEIDDIAPGVYEFQVRSVNSLGVHSAYVTVTKEITGLGAPPADMTGLTITAVGGMAVMRWDEHPDLDVREGGEFRFRHAPAFTGVALQTSTTIGDPVDGQLTSVALPLKPGTYLARVFDSSGIPSGGVVMVTTKQAALVAFANTDTVFEDPGFLGVHDGTAGVDGVLKLGGGSLIDDWVDFDAVADFDSEGGIASSGVYDFAAGIDFGSVVRRRLTASVTALVNNTLDAIDDRTGLIDDWEDFDGVATGSADAQVWMRQTDDDPAGSPAWGDWHRLDSMEVEARGLDFQARLSASDPAYNILVSALRVDADEVV